LCLESELLEGSRAFLGPKEAAVIRQSDVHVTIEGLPCTWIDN